jgi:hypothetical protein
LLGKQVVPLADATADAFLAANRIGHGTVAQVAHVDVQCMAGEATRSSTMCQS